LDFFMTLSCCSCEPEIRLLASNNGLTAVALTPAPSYHSRPSSS
jgi:hypothetical protein